MTSHHRSSSHNYVYQITKKHDQMKYHQYKKGDQIGKGGFATCYKTVRQSDQRLFAMKVIQLADKNESNQSNEKHKSKKHSHPSTQEKAYLEAKILRACNHPNIVRYQTDFIYNKEFYIIMEYCQKGCFGDMLKARGKISQIQARFFIRQMVHGLQYLKSRRIIHRDLKPANYLLTQGLQLKITDFGLSTQVRGNRPVNRNVCGTPNYLSPQMVMRLDYSYEVDLWAIGVILYTMLYGIPPFETKERLPDKTYERIKNLQYRFYNSYISYQARDLIRKLLVLDPHGRISLEKILDHPFMTKFQIPPYLNDKYLKNEPQGGFIKKFSRQKEKKSSHDRFNVRSQIRINNSQSNRLSQSFQQSSKASSLLRKKQQKKIKIEIKQRQHRNNRRQQDDKSKRQRQDEQLTSSPKSSQSIRQKEMFSKNVQNNRCIKNIKYQSGQQKKQTIIIKNSNSQTQKGLSIDKRREQYGHMSQKIGTKEKNKNENEYMKIQGQNFNKRKQVIAQKKVSEIERKMKLQIQPDNKEQKYQQRIEQIKKQEKIILQIKQQKNNQKDKELQKIQQKIVQEKDENKNEKTNDANKDMNKQRNQWEIKQMERLNGLMKEIKYNKIYQDKRNVHMIKNFKQQMKRRIKGQTKKIQIQQTYNKQINQIDQLLQKNDSSIINASSTKKDQSIRKKDESIKKINKDNSILIHNSNDKIYKQKVVNKLNKIYVFQDFMNLCPSIYKESGKMIKIVYCLREQTYSNQLKLQSVQQNPNNMVNKQETNKQKIRYIGTIFYDNSSIITKITQSNGQIKQSSVYIKNVLHSNILQQMSNKKVEYNKNGFDLVHAQQIQGIWNNYQQESGQECNPKINLIKDQSMVLKIKILPKILSTKQFMNKIKSSIPNINNDSRYKIDVKNYKLNLKIKIRYAEDTMKYFKQLLIKQHPGILNYQSNEINSQNIGNKTKQIYNQNQIDQNFISDQKHPKQTFIFVTKFRTRKYQNTLYFQLNNQQKHYLQKYKQNSLALFQYDTQKINHYNHKLLQYNYAIFSIQNQSLFIQNQIKTFEQIKLSNYFSNSQTRNNVQHLFNQNNILFHDIKLYNDKIQQKSQFSANNQYQSLYSINSESSIRKRQYDKEGLKQIKQHQNLRKIRKNSLQTLSKPIPIQNNSKPIQLKNKSKQISINLKTNDTQTINQNFKSQNIKLSNSKLPQRKSIISAQPIQMLNKICEQFTKNFQMIYLKEQNKLNSEKIYKNKQNLIKHKSIYSKQKEIKNGQNELKSIQNEQKQKEGKKHKQEQKYSKRFEIRNGKLDFILKIEEFMSSKDSLRKAEEQIVYC